MIKMYLLIDFINPQKNVAITEDLDKIRFNVEHIEPLKKNIAEQKKTNKVAVACITVFGRWIVVYRANIANDDNTTLNFIDFRIDIDDLASVFPESTIRGMKQIQTQYDAEFTPALDTVELTFADLHEKVLKENFFFAEEDIFVLTKAKKLGALETISRLNDNDKIKLTLVDERETLNDKAIINVYALINFGEHEGKEKHESGFAYLKIFDLENNFDRVIDFQKAIEHLGVTFDRAFFTERFRPERLN